MQEHAAAVAVTAVILAGASTIATTGGADGRGDAAARLGRSVSPIGGSVRLVSTRQIAPTHRSSVATTLRAFVLEHRGTDILLFFIAIVHFEYSYE